MIVFAYNFPHWKTQMGLINMVSFGFVPDMVILQNRKVLNVPQSEYRITPKEEYLLEPVDTCNMLGLKFMIMDHEDYKWQGYDLGVILGARILSQELISRFGTGILNIHPGILPGNRGLDNLKHSIARRLPIGVTAHLIDNRIDMGRILATKKVPVYPDDTIRDVYNRQRNYEIKLLIETLQANKWEGEPCEYSDKFGIVSPDVDINIHSLFSTYKKYFA